MERKLLLIVCFVLALTSALFVGVNLYLPNLHELFVNDNKNHLYSELVEIEHNDELLEDSKGGVHDIRLEFPRSVDMDTLSYSDDFLNKEFSFMIRGISQNYLDRFSVVSKDNNRIKDILYENESKLGEFVFSFYEMIETDVLVEDHIVFLDFNTPKEKYKKIVVIDPGFGGNELGFARDSNYEKDINLSIAKKLNDKLIKALDGVGVYMTRDKDIDLSEKSRVDFTNEIEADIMISIQQNSTASGRVSDISGTEVLYLTTDPSGESKKLASIALERLVSSLGSENKGIVAGDENIIISESNCPAIVAKIGYMTNVAELDSLLDEKYQDKCVEALEEAIMEYLNENSNSNR